MKISDTQVALLSCREYNRERLKELFERLFEAIGFSCAYGSRVLLKPNLVSVNVGYGNPACTHPEFIAAAAEWFLDQGVVVAVGDSPAFGAGRQVLKAIGALEKLKPLPIRYADFRNTSRVKLAHGMEAEIAVEALECDCLVNMPKVKAHSQMVITMAIKNYFGVVAGLQKPWWHMRFGDRPDLFAALLVDLLEHLPEGVNLVDGIEAMHRKGPTGGDLYPLHLIAASRNPVAVDRALESVIGLDTSILMGECRRRGYRGARLEEVHFPLVDYSSCAVDDFLLPAWLKPVSFNPVRMGISSLKRIWDQFFPGSRRKGE